MLFFENYRQKIFQKSCFNNEILKSLFEFRSKFMLNFTYYKSKMKNVQSKLLPKLDLYIWVLLKKSMYKLTDMYKCTCTVTWIYFTTVWRSVLIRDEPSTTHNSTHFLTCVVYVLCICKPIIDMCGHVCHMSTQLFKKCVSKLCISTKISWKLAII